MAKIKEGYDVKTTAEWRCPADTGIPLITMPNVPRPLHGLPPREIMGKTMWNKVRKRCYYNAEYRCEICGDDPQKGHLHAHELYSYNFMEGTGRFERCVAICKQDHDFIHSGRLITMYKNNNPLYPKSYVLGVVEKGFNLICEYNKVTKGEKLRAYATFLEYLKVPSIEQEMRALIEKYNIKFYSEPKHIAKWGEWRLLYGNKEYPTPYANQEEWVQAMAERAKKDSDRIAGANPFSGEVFSKIDSILEEE